VSVFNEPGDARDYLLLASSTFLVFLSHSTITYLSVILRDLGVEETGIGVIMSATLAPMLVGMFLCGHLMERFSPLKVVRAGFVMILLAHLSLQFTISDFSGVYLSRAFHGFGYGIFMPAGMTYVKGKLRPETMVHPFGIYSSMILFPNVVGPWIMENLYGVMGLVGPVSGYRCSIHPRERPGGIPRPDKEYGKGGKGTGYTRLLRMAGLRPLYLTIFLVGMVYGIVPTLMALYLSTWKVLVVYYFTPFTAALFTARFVVIRFLGRFPRKFLVTVGLVFMGLSYLWLLVFRSAPAAVLAGIVMGLGYSLEYPSLSVWISEKFEQKERAKPVALLNMVFNAGIYITPLVGGWVMDRLTPETYLILLIILALGTALGIVRYRES